MFPTLVQVRYKRGLRKITCLRFLCTKIIVEEKKVSRTDVLALYDLLLWAQDKALMDPEFQKKFGRSLEVLARILKETQISNQNVEPATLTKKVRVKIKNDLTEFLYPPRNYQSIKERMSGNFHLERSRPAGVENSKLPPERYIGKGYGDKGTAKKPELDGSPTWQQIAASEEFQLKTLLEILRRDKSLTIRNKLSLQKEAKELIERLKRSRVSNRARVAAKAVET